MREDKLPLIQLGKLHRTFISPTEGSLAMDSGSPFITQTIMKLCSFTNSTAVGVCANGREDYIERFIFNIA